MSNKRIKTESPLRAMANKRLRTEEPTHSVTCAAPDAFPYFSRGSVVIELIEDNPKYQYRLHKMVLQRCSKLFSEELELEQPVVRGLRYQSKHPVNVKFFYKLEHVERQREAEGTFALGNSKLTKQLLYPARPLITVNPGMISDLTGPDISPVGASSSRPDNFNAPNERLQLKEEPVVDNEEKLINPQTIRASRSQAGQAVKLKVESPSTTGRLPDAAPGDSIEASKSAAREFGVPKDVKAETLELQVNSSLQRLLLRNENRTNDGGTVKPLEPVTECIVEAYNNLFLIFYNLPPILTTDDITFCLVECELLVQIAESFGSLPVVRPYLSDIFFQYRGELFKAISKDPPRWLKISVTLQSSVIFAEALIHIVGSYPKWTWPTRADKLSANLLSLIAAKSRDLMAKRHKVHTELIMVTVRIGKEPVQWTGDSEEYETWFVVQMFRDWLCKKLLDRREQDREYDGSYFRAIAKGGDAYLPFETVSRKLNRFKGGDYGSWAEVGNDLRMVKEAAGKEVEELVKNNLMLDVEAANIKYLTCTKVDNADYPWNESITKE